MEEIKWYNSESEAILKKGYLLKGETVNDAIHRVASTVSNIHNRPDLYDRVVELIVKGWASLSSPLWANLGTERGYPISCFNVHVSDSIESLTKKISEVIMQTKYGGGTSAFFDMREMGAPITDNGESNGPVAFMKIFDSAIDKISQGATRKGAFAAYMDITHPDIMDFLKIKSIGSDIQNIFTGVSIPEGWMEAMDEGDTDKRKVWAEVLKSRKEKGIPYIFYAKNVADNRPDIYKALDLKINASNLCTEILLPSTDEESFICCLMSMNIDTYDEWRNTNAVETAMFILDAVLTDFINKTEGKYGFEATRRFAMRHRAIGLGVLGYHSYLQQHNIPFESEEARTINREIFKYLHEETYRVSAEMAKTLGPAPIFGEAEIEGPVRRHTVTMAIAPTTSSSAILGQVSAGIEPLSSNYYKAGLAKGNFPRKNKYLEALLISKGLDENERKKIWKSILFNKGSVQHLDILTDHEKNVFKTFREISQKEIVIQACSRQRFIDQGQSLNLNIPPEVPLKEVNKLMVDAYFGGVTTLYYQRSQSVAKELIANIVACSSCES